ncbi:la-related protein 6C isoform X2 [Andrographis paniculata]|uniref:la-related protein 6C isoform X2 n=1 Tax=Andrographis paniculata TaxID=175694 RepID=UPI0021E6F56D|nr:la-related protein 6C isoform X2 [Andrographis paniculata]
MAQASEKRVGGGEAVQMAPENRKDSGNGSGGGWGFKFNAAAPEFVPRSHSHVQPHLPLSGYFYPQCFQCLDGINGNWIYYADQQASVPLVGSKVAPPLNHPAKENVLTEDLKQKIVKQAEYMFSDISLLANESIAKHVSKDPEGFVPINFVTTAKKLKSLNVSNPMVAQALQSSSNLVVSSDGKKVRRKHPLTDKDKEDLMLRSVIVENLPDDHSHHNIEKLFNVVGSIKSIRICQPQEPNSSRSSKGDLVVSNKLHALIEYETPEAAEKAAETLNDERNWRKGMRVRVMLKRSPKSVLRSRKSDFDVCSDDEEGTPCLSQEDASPTNSAEVDENSCALKKSWSKNRAKPKHRPHIINSTSTTPNSSLPTKGPRMPDGTRGFAMGRGKPLCVQVQSS